LVAHQHYELFQELGIEELHGIRLTIQPPQSYVRDQDDPVTWGTEGGIREFLAGLNNVAEEIYKPYARFNKRDDCEAQAFRMDTDQLQRLGSILEKRGTNLHGMLQALTAKQMLLKTDFEVVQRGTRFCYHPDSMSEGEKQLVCVVGGLTLAKNIECLVLLDEPDTHLNPAWSWRYNNLLKQALTSQQRTTSTTIMATHDPIMISGLTREQVFIARKEGRQLIYDSPVRGPRGQGVANILVSEYFGLPSSLDENTQLLLDERLRLAYKQERLTDEESVRLTEINKQLDMLGLSISFRDPAYKEFEEQKFREIEGQV
jgi:ABC-type Fe3+/spermidine/putrescine transport system ATPase subunit